MNTCKLDKYHIFSIQKLLILFILNFIFIIYFYSDTRSISHNSEYKSIKIEGVPHVLQKPDFCGEACVEMYLRKRGYNITQNDVFNMSGIDPLQARGCYTFELVKALKGIGFQIDHVWYEFPANKVEKMSDQWCHLYNDLLKGIPSIVCMHTDKTPTATEHFRLILGYDFDKNEVIYHEPAEMNGKYKRMGLKDFLECWPLKYNTKKWTIVRIPLKLYKINRIKRFSGFTNADYVQHMMKLKRKIPQKGFTVTLQKPFFVISDESPDVVEFLSNNIIKWAIKKLKFMYFKRDPGNIIDIWLFNGKCSYRKYTWKIFRERPETPFGYFYPERNALFMNIRTGTGTLVHEMVHAYIKSNFPKCPSWFNEGLASLYEQAKGKGNKIIGLTNWRLDGLKIAVQNGLVPSFKILTSTTDSEFYSPYPGTNYAQARYLCYYLQEKGLLMKYFHTFHTNFKKDPTGYETLNEVLGENDMEAFKKKWEQFVLKLKKEF